jgi:pimeloyl-ACP methyl ester carboxylesterase
MDRVQANNITIAYELAGEGDPVIMINGLGADHSAWANQAPHYTARFRCLFYDNRGVGLSDKPPGPYTTRMLADDAVALMDALDIGRAHIVGASMGGAIAQEVALNYPNHVRSLSIHCSWARCDAWTRRIFEIMRGMAVRLGPHYQDYMHDVQRYLSLLCFTQDDFNERTEIITTAEALATENPHPQPWDAFVAQVDACLTHDTLERLPQIEAPTLLTVGAEDIFTPPRLSRQIFEQIPRVELEIFEGCGHVMFYEKPAEWNAKTLAFLESH